MKNSVPQSTEPTEQTEPGHRYRKLPEQLHRGDGVEVTGPCQTKHPEEAESTKDSATDLESAMCLPTHT